MNHQIGEVIANSSKIRFLVLDLGYITGIDYSALESFGSIARKLNEEKIHLIFCDLGNVATELAKTGIFDAEIEDHSLVHAFENLNQALEWCENCLLSTYYRKERAQGK